MLGNALKLFVSRAEGYPICVAGPAQTVFKMDVEDHCRTLYANGVSVCTLRPKDDGYVVGYGSNFPRFSLRVYRCTDPNSGEIVPRNLQGHIRTIGPLVLLVKIPVASRAECIIIADSTIFELCEGLLATQE